MFCFSWGCRGVGGIGLCFLFPAFLLGFTSFAEEGSVRPSRVVGGQVRSEEEEAGVVGQLEHRVRFALLRDARLEVGRGRGRC